jgi:hypothetical protein
LQTGRIWGVWNKELLPIRWETAQVSLRDAGWVCGGMNRQLP